MSMSISYTSNDDAVLYVVHPLDDVLEQKKSVEGLDQIHMSPAVRASLYTLRGYLILITLLALYRLCDLLGIFGHHIKH